MKFLTKKRYRGGEIDPDEIFIDSRNLPEFDTRQFEGKIEHPISKRTFVLLGTFFTLVSGVYLWKVFDLQIMQGEYFYETAENNRLEHTIIFTERGIILDRNGTELAWNEPFENNSAESAQDIDLAQNEAKEEKEKPFALRRYIRRDGLGHLLGYVHYPQKDSNGFYYQEAIRGEEGIEQYYDGILAGKNGLTLVEKNALGETVSHNVLELPEEGENLILTIDARVQEKLFTLMGGLAQSHDFYGGSGIVLDVENGEILALTSYPEYDPEVFSFGRDRELINAYRMDAKKPFLNRAVSGLYTPGSIVKPFIALAALEESIISPEKEILSTGSIAIPHPYFPDRESVFYDWRAHGYVDLVEALAYSSNVYFYEIGGGFKDQKGLGIERMTHYLRLFGLGDKTGIDLYGEREGILPTPEWKLTAFHDQWRLGDTYHTAIGQFGFQMTPLQAVLAAALLANDGSMKTPRLLKAVETYKQGTPNESLQLVVPAKKDTKLVIANQNNFQIVRKGMRAAVEYGTAKGLFFPDFSVAAKTGTAQTGTKGRVNSWAIGFFPYEKPRYAFAVVMEHGPEDNLVGAVYIVRELLLWMSQNTEEYTSN